MKKKYITPALLAIKIQTTGMMATSGLTGTAPGQGYTSSDVSYGRDDDGDWEDEEF